MHFRQINLLSETEWLVVRSYYVKGKDDVGYDCFCSSELQRNIDLAWKDGFAGVFFSGAEKYIVVQGRNGFTVSNIPEDLENELNRRNRENMQIGGIFLAPNGSWVMRGFSEKKLDKTVLLE